MTSGLCPDCNDPVELDAKEESSIIKIGARCFTCGRDFGVFEYVKSRDIEHIDQAYECGEQRFEQVFS